MNLINNFEMKNYLKTILLTLFLFYTEGGFTQTRFKATALVGVNFGQIDGDRQQGYRNRGVSLGLDGSIYIRPDFDISIELLYNKKGAKFNPNDRGKQNITLTTFSLNYSEVALLLNYHYRPNNIKNYYTQSLFGGLSYGRLLKSSASIIKENQPLTTLESEILGRLKPHDFSFIVGWSQLFTPKIGASFRFTRSINLLYLNPNYKHLSIEPAFEFLKPYFISLHGFYNLVSPNKTMGLKSKKQKARNNPLEELY